MCRCSPDPATLRALRSLLGASGCGAECGSRVSPSLRLPPPGGKAIIFHHEFFSERLWLPGVSASSLHLCGKAASISKWFAFLAGRNLGSGGLRDPLQP